MSSRIIEVVIDLNDRTGGKLEGFTSKLLAFDKKVQALHSKLAGFANRAYSATVSLIDRVTTPGSRINSFLKNLAGKIYRVTINANDGALNKIRNIEAALARLAGKAYTIGVNLRDNVTKKLGGISEGLLSGAMMGAGVFAPVLGAAGVGFGVGNALENYINFEYMTSKVAAITGKDKSSDEMKTLIEQAKQLGRDTEWTRTQVAEAQFYEALAGWSPAQIQAATPHILNLATAGGTELGRASDIVTDSMTAFGIKAQDTYERNGQQINAVERFVDMLAKTQASSNTTVEMLGEVSKYAAPVIGGMYSTDTAQGRMDAARDTLVMAGLMANAGIKASMGGTAIRGVFNRFAGGNRNAWFGLQAMGVDVFDERGEFLPVREIAKSFQNKIKNGVNLDELNANFEELAGVKIHADTRRKLDQLYSNLQKNGGKFTGADIAKLSSMFAGAEHMSGLMAVLLGDWDALYEKIDNCDGAAQKMADTMNDNLRGDLLKLGSAWDSFTQGFFEGGAGDGLRNFVQSLTEVIANAEKLFKDGIQLGDLGRIGFDIVDRLKNKFLELDGVGSILAGGALMAGLLKMRSVMQSIIAYGRELRTTIQGGTPPPGTRGGSTKGGVPPISSQVGTMHVTAGTVYINGTVAGGQGQGGAGSGSDELPGENAGGGDNGGSGGGGSRSRWQIAKSAAKEAAVITGAFAGIDSYFAREQAEQTNQLAADETIRQTLRLNEMKQAGDYSQEELAQQTKLVEDAKANQTKVKKENADDVMRTDLKGIGMTGGAAVGAGLGAISPIPGGALVGTILGGFIGDLLGGKVADFAKEHGINGDNFQKKMQEYWTEKFQGANEAFMDFFSFGKKAEAAELTPAQQAQQAAMERGEVVTAPTENISAEPARTEKTLAVNFDLPEFNLSEKLSELLSFDLPEFNLGEKITELLSFDLPEINLGEQISEMFSGIGETIWENLSGALESMLNFGEQVQETLSSACEGAGEIISNLGATLSEGLSTAVASATETFSAFGEMVSSALVTAQSAAESALASISAAFDSALAQITGAWSALPGIFSGIFSGLGGAAEAAGSAIYSGLTSIIGAVIGAWQSAASAVSSIISSISAMASSISLPSFGGGGGGKYAEGGFVTRPTYGLVGEAGSEVIIPLNPSRRARALDLFEKTGAILGGDAMTFAGDELAQVDSPDTDFADDFNVPNVPSLDAPDSESSAQFSNSNSNSAQISIGGINISFDLPSVQNAQDFMENIQGNLNDIAQAIASKLAAQIADIHQNQALEA